ncbi:Transcription factor GTE8-like protein [Drosera capensis]
MYQSLRCASLRRLRSSSSTPQPKSPSPSTQDFIQSLSTTIDHLGCIHSSTVLVKKLKLRVALLSVSVQYIIGRRHLIRYAPTLEVVHMAPAVPVVCTGCKEAKRCSQKPLMQLMGGKGAFSNEEHDGVVPDYHYRETMAESEEFGSSRQMDIGMILSGDLSHPYGKHINLDVDGLDHFRIPAQVLSLSKMSKSERKELEMKLRRELEQLRVLQKEVTVLAANSSVLSPVSDIPSSSDGQKRPELDSSQAAPEQHGQGKKRGPPIHNGSQEKTGNPGRGGPPKQGMFGRGPNVVLMNQCGNLLKQMMSHKYGWVFNAPVDVVKLGIPDYFQIIKHPMDLGTIKGRMSSGEYSSPMDFAADVRLTFSNALTYNAAGTDVHFMAKVLSEFFEQRWKSIEKKIRANASTQSAPPKADTQTGNQTMNKIPPSKKKRDVSSSKMLREDLIKTTMTDVEKVKLSAKLESLLTELPDTIIDFLKESSSTAGQNNEDEMEIDIDALSDETLFKLTKLLDDYLLEKKKKQIRSEPREIELCRESGFSNSSMKPSKVNDVVYGSAGIGARDPDIVEIDKDMAQKNMSVSSSSGPGSSSDSSNSSGDETEHATSLPILKKLKSISGQSERKSLTKTLSIKMDGDKEGESAPPVMQVSPDKLYRAALLKNRFADTIIKAQEKTLEKTDPEKLRLEKEELEQRQKEAKARLQAEAKAAEVARRKAQALAAAEAKRKRESEREAARLALQKMEKTVEINENSKFMEDLALLSSAPPDDLSTLLGSGSPNDGDNSLLGSFKFRGTSNPLEQLGLYMKVDEEEEEEELEAPKSAVVDPINDVEEGEIDP